MSPHSSEQWVSSFLSGSWQEHDFPSAVSPWQREAPHNVQSLLTWMNQQGSYILTPLNVCVCIKIYSLPHSQSERCKEESQWDTCKEKRLPPCRFHSSWLSPTSLVQRFYLPSILGWPKQDTYLFLAQLRQISCKLNWSSTTEQKHRQPINYFPFEQTTTYHLCGLFKILFFGNFTIWILGPPVTLLHVRLTEPSPEYRPAELFSAQHRSTRCFITPCFPAYLMWPCCLLKGYPLLHPQYSPQYNLGLAPAVKRTMSKDLFLEYVFSAHLS